MIWEERK